MPPQQYLNKKKEAISVATIDQKVTAMSKLMQEGILTTDEFVAITGMLASGKEINKEDTSAEITPLEKKYEDVIRNKIAYAFKSPAGVKFPALEPSMIKEGKLKIMMGWSIKEQYVRYVETYVDAPNSYGTMLRQKLAIVIDEDFEPQMVVTPVKGLLGGDTDTWSIMSGVKL